MRKTTPGQGSLTGALRRAAIAIEGQTRAGFGRYALLLLTLVVASALGGLAPACDGASPNELKPHPAIPTADPFATSAIGFVLEGEGSDVAGEVAVTEGNVVHVFVTLTDAPDHPVTATVSVSLPSVLDVSPKTLTFNASNYNAPQTLTLSALQDNNAVSEVVTLKLKADKLADGSLNVTVKDDDTQGLVATPTLLTVTEGATDVFTVNPAFAPAGDMVVTVVSTKTTAATVSPATLTFTAANFQTPQTVTVTGVVDPNVVDESVDLLLKTDGLADTAVSVTVVDKDVLNISVQPSALSLVEGGPAKTFAVAMTQQPSANVTVTLASSDVGAATASPATLTFTPSNYAVPQNVTVTPVSDMDTMNEAVTVTASAAGLTPRDVSIAVKDDDVQDIQPSTTAVTVNEGGTATFTVKLPFDPVTPLTVNLTTSNPAAAAVSPATLTFTSANYATPQTATVTGVLDSNTVSETVALTLTSTGLTTKTVTATTVDKDVQAIVVSPAAASVTEIGTSTLSVSLAFNPLASTTVTVASSDPTAMTVAPATLTFTAANYASPQTVTLSGVKSAGTVNRSANAIFAAAGIASVTVPVTVVSVAGQSLSIAPSSVTLTEGGAAGAVGIKLTQAPAANVTVSVASQNTGVATVSPATLTFTPANYATAQTITISPIHDTNTVTDTTLIAVSAAGITTQNVNVTVNDIDVQSIVVSPATLSVTEGSTATFTVALAAAPTATTAVTITSSNGLAASASPTSLTFTSTNYATPQTVTVTGVPDANMTSETVSLTVASGGLTSTVTVTTIDTTKPTCDMPGTLPSPASGNHNAGLSCIQSGCHTVARASVPAAMTVAGTLYSTISGGTAIAQATIHVIDANGVDLKLVTAQNGNFWTTAAVTFPVTVRASLCPNTDQKMSSTVASAGGSCNSCHGSGNRIHLP